MKKLLILIMAFAIMATPSIVDAKRRSGGSYSKPSYSSKSHYSSKKRSTATKKSQTPVKRPASKSVESSTPKPKKVVSKNEIYKSRSERAAERSGGSFLSNPLVWIGAYLFITRDKDHYCSNGSTVETEDLCVE